jgi:hypothetical protein
VSGEGATRTSTMNPEWEATMSEQTPSQAEGERRETAPDTEQETSGRRDVPRTTPSQAEGDDTESTESTDAENGTAGT